jgi:hypothetical protein
MVGVTGSIPVVPTIGFQLSRDSEFERLFGR